MRAYSTTVHRKMWMVISIDCCLAIIQFCFIYCPIYGTFNRAKTRAGCRQRRIMLVAGAYRRAQLSRRPIPTTRTLCIIRSRPSKHHNDLGECNINTCFGGTDDIFALRWLVLGRVQCVVETSPRASTCGVPGELKLAATVSIARDTRCTKSLDCTEIATLMCFCR